MRPKIGGGSQDLFVLDTFHIIASMLPKRQVREGLARDVANTAAGYDSYGHEYDLLVLCFSGDGHTEDIGLTLRPIHHARTMAHCVHTVIVPISNAQWFGRFVNQNIEETSPRSRQQPLLP